MNKRNRLYKIVLVALISILLISVNVGVVRADMDAVKVSFKNLENVECYATLLSESKESGPFHSWDGDVSNIRRELFGESEDLDYDIWSAFAHYDDEDEFFFLQIVWRVSDEKPIIWTYFPPSTFKVLLYFPSTGTFAVSDIMTAYASESNFTIDMKGVNVSSTENPIKISPHKSYNYFLLILMLLARIIIVVAIEMGIALLFKYRSKSQLLIIGITHTILQVIINVPATIIYYYMGGMYFLLAYLIAAVILFIIKVIAYMILLPQKDKRGMPVLRALLYTLAASAISFIAGLVLAYVDVSFV